SLPHNHRYHEPLSHDPPYHKPVSQRGPYRRPIQKSIYHEPHTLGDLQTQKDPHYRLHSQPSHAIYSPISVHKKRNIVVLGPSVEKQEISLFRPALSQTIRTLKPKPIPSQPMQSQPSLKSSTIQTETFLLTSEEKEKLQVEAQLDLIQQQIQELESQYHEQRKIRKKEEKQAKKLIQEQKEKEKRRKKREERRLRRLQERESQLEKDREKDHLIAQNRVFFRPNMHKYDFSTVDSRVPSLDESPKKDTEIHTKESSLFQKSEIDHVSLPSSPLSQPKYRPSQTEYKTSSLCPSSPFSPSKPSTSSSKHQHPGSSRLNTSKLSTSMSLPTSSSSSFHPCSAAHPQFSQTLSSLHKKAEHLHQKELYLTKIGEQVCSSFRKSLDIASDRERQRIQTLDHVLSEIQRFRKNRREKREARE
ncbi:hypothetical protein ADUPG1_000194, partial [Aduncisulcus paluster]